MDVPAAGPVTVLVTEVVPVTTGAFVVAGRVVEPVTVENVEVVLVELVVAVLLVDETTDVVVVVVGPWNSSTLLLRKSETHRLPDESNATAAGWFRPFCVVAAVFVVKLL